MKTMFQYDHYYAYEELTQTVKTLAKDFPDLVTLESIAKSEKGRDIWAVTITNHHSGPALSKPAFYIDANTHAGEVTGSMAAIHTMDVLCSNYGTDTKITRMLDDMTFYVIPRISVDGSEVYLTTPYDLRSVDRPYLSAVQKPGVVAEDMDQDGIVRMMRIKDKHGAWKINADNHNLMEKRKPDDRFGDFYTVVSEGMIEGYDKDKEIQPAPVFWGLDFNRNYPYGWFNESRQPGSGKYPLSNIENKAVVDFVLAHRNIGAVATHHTSGGVILYPPGTRSEKSAHDDDMRRFREIGAMATEEMGYKAINIFDNFMSDQENYSSGAFDDWCFLDQGIPAYTIELWNLLERAGVSVDWSQDHREEKECLETWTKVLNWCSENAPDSFESWTPYEHPQLGVVEIGGLNLKFTHENCPNDFLLQEVEKTTRFCLRYAMALPQLAIDKTEVNWLGEDLAEVKVTVSNEGYLPTYLSQEARDLGKTEPVKVSLQGDIKAYIAGDALTEIGDLEGYSGSNAEYDSCSVSTGAHDPIKKTVRWLVQVDKGTVLNVIAFQPKAGRACEPVQL